MDSNLNPDPPPPPHHRNPYLPHLLSFIGGGPPVDHHPPSEAPPPFGVRFNLNALQYLQSRYHLLFSANIWCKFYN